MNINTQGLSLFSNYGLKSTKDRMDRMAQRDNSIAFFEQQKANLKNMETSSIEDIARKLDLFHNYDDRIVAERIAYNNSQALHILDEAQELGEKIAENAEKYKPKTPEERREDMIEEATGVDQDEGMMSEMLDELSEVTEEMTEDSLDKEGEDSVTLLSEEERIAVQSNEEQLQDKIDEESLQKKYKRIDFRV